MNEKLDLKDRKILFELEQNSRQSLQQIAKKVGLKKETIFHRIKNLEKKGIIKKYLAEIDIYKLGYQFYPVLLRYQDTNPKTEEEIYSYLRKNNYVAWLTKCEGSWDVNLTLIAKNNLEVSEFFNKFMEKYSKYIAEKHVFITTEIHYFKRNFQLKKPTLHRTSTEDKKELEIKKEDYQILSILANESRKSIVDLSEILERHPKTIASQIKKLEKERVIQGYRILVDFNKIGYKFHKIWFSLNNMNNKNFDELLRYFKDHPNIIWATKTIGFYDLSIEVEVEDIEQFRKILSEIKHKFSHLIKRHESLLIFEEGIMNYFPPRL